MSWLHLGVSDTPPWEFSGKPQSESRLTLGQLNAAHNHHVFCNLASILHVRTLSSSFRVTKCANVQGKKRYNKYTQICAQAVRQSLKETERLAAEKRGLTSLRYQHWEGGKGGEQVSHRLNSRKFGSDVVFAKVHLNPPPDKA